MTQHETEPEEFDRIRRVFLDTLRTGGLPNASATAATRKAMIRELHRAAGLPAPDHAVR